MKNDPSVSLFNWDVIEKANMWMLRVGTPDGGDRFINVMPTSSSWEQAVDAALDFIDRLRNGRVRDFNDPWSLMSSCVSAARRQR